MHYVLWDLLLQSQGDNSETFRQRKVLKGPRRSSTKPLSLMGMTTKVILTFSKAIPTFVFFSHNDFPLSLRNLLNNDLRDFDFNMNLSSLEPWASHWADHTDLPRMREGRAGGQVILEAKELNASVATKIYYSFGPPSLAAMHSSRMQSNCSWSRMM